MRPFSVLLVMCGLGLAPAATAGQACVGLQCLQTQNCPANSPTSISGVVYAPNGTDPLPNVTVYIPNAPVAAFTPGVSCPPGCVFSSRPVPAIRLRPSAGTGLLLK